MAFSGGPTLPISLSLASHMAGNEWPFRSLVTSPTHKNARLADSGQTFVNVAAHYQPPMRRSQLLLESW